MSDTTIELDYETTTRNFLKYTSKKDGYIITVYLPRTPSRPRSVKVIVENG